jgi:TolA-binding protein
MSKQELELIEEKFKGLTSLMNAHFENVDDRLERIEEQTKKTNGRVTELEHKELTHTQNCPQTVKIEKINEELAEYKMFKKYPKIALALIAGAVLLFIITTFESIEKVKKSATPQNIEILKETGNQLNDTLNIF